MVIQIYTECSHTHCSYKLSSWLLQVRWRWWYVDEAILATPPSLQTLLSAQQTVTDSILICSVQVSGYPVWSPLSTCNPPHPHQHLRHGPSRLLTHHILINEPHVQTVLPSVYLQSTLTIDFVNTMVFFSNSHVPEAEDGSFAEDDW